MRMTTELQVELAKHSEQIEGLRTDVHMIRENLSEIAQSVGMIKISLAEQRGGVKVLIMLTTAISTISGAVGAFFSRFFGTH